MERCAVCLCNHRFKVCAGLVAWDKAYLTLLCFLLVTVMQQDHRNTEVIGLSSFDEERNVGQSLLALC